MNPVNVDVKLGVNKFFVDEENAHIELLDNPSAADFRLLELACPAGLYRQDEKGQYHFDYAGCLECGACRIVAGTSVLKKWEYPLGTLGVEFRYG